MWQLHKRWSARDLGELDQEQHLRQSTGMVSLLRWAAMLVGAVVAGLVGTQVLRPINYPVVLVMAIGGMAAVLVFAVVPGEALRLLLRFAISVSVARRRNGLRRLVLEEQNKRLGAGDGRGDLSILCDLAAAEYLLGDLEAAEQHLGEVLELRPEDPSALNNFGVVLAAQGRYHRAAAAFIRAVRSGNTEEALENCGLIAPLVTDDGLLQEIIAASGTGRDASTLNNIGVSYARRGHWDLAREWFLWAERRDPSLAAAYANAGLVHYQANELQAALDRLSQADRLAPADPSVANCLGVIFGVAGQADRARHYFRRAHNAEPANVGIRVNAALAEARAGRLKAACARLRALTREAPARACASYNLAVLELAAQDPSSAANSAAAAIEAGDAGPDAYTTLAVALWETGRNAEALSHFLTAARASETVPVAASNLARALLVSDDVGSAMEVLTQAHDRWPQDPHVAFDYATASLAVAAQQRAKAVAAGEPEPATDLDVAYSILEEAERRGGEMAAEAHANMGLLMYLRGEPRRAAEHFRMAARAAPGLRELHFLIGTALGQAGEKDTHETETGSWAITAEGLELLRQAIPHLEQACEVREILPDALYNLGRALYAAEEFERALEAFRRALRVEDSEEMNAMAGLAAARQARSWQNATKVQFLMPETRKQDLVTRSHALLDAAVHYFRQALVRNELNPVLHANIGLAYILRNYERDVEAALHHWQRMRIIAGPEVERRYADLVKTDDPSHIARLQFDDREVALRPLGVLRWLAVPPPRPAGLHWTLEPLAVQRPWRVMVGAERLRAALVMRDDIAAREARLAKLRA